MKTFKQFLKEETKINLPFIGKISYLLGKNNDHAFYTGTDWLWIDKENGVYSLSIVSGKDSHDVRQFPLVGAVYYPNGKLKYAFRQAINLYIVSGEREKEIEKMIKSAVNDAYYYDDKSINKTPNSWISKIISKIKNELQFN